MGRRNVNSFFKDFENKIDAVINFIQTNCPNKTFNKKEARKALREKCVEARKKALNKKVKIKNFLYKKFLIFNFLFNFNTKFLNFIF